MEGEKDQWNEPSTSKAGQYSQDENEEKQNASSMHLFEREIPSTDIILADKQALQNDSPVLHGQADKEYVAIQNQPKPAPTYFMESDIQPISDPEDHTTNKDNDTSSAPISQGAKDSGVLEEPGEDGGRLENTDEEGQNIASNSKTLQQQIDSKNEEDAKVETDSIPEQATPAKEEIENKTQPPKPGPSSQTPQDPAEEMYEFLNTIYNPSPYIQKKKIDYEKNKLSQFNEKIAMKIMEKMVLSSMIAFNKQQPEVPQGPPLEPEQLEELAMKVNELEKRLHRVDREKRESEREKRNLMEQVNELELRALEMKKVQLMKKIIAADEPSEKDIELLNQLKELFKYQNESTKELRELERQNRVMERVLSHAERSLLSSPWFHNMTSKAAAPVTELPPVFADPLAGKRKIRFNHVGTVVYFDNKDPPIKVPRWNSESVQPLNISAGDQEKWDDEEDEDLMEEKMEELRRKKEEEKLVKRHAPFEEEDEEEEERGRSASSVSEDSSVELGSTKEDEVSIKEEQK